MSTSKMIAPKLLQQMKEYSWNKLEIYPFDKTCISQLRYITTFFNDKKIAEEIGYKELVNIVKEVQTLDTKTIALDEGSRAMIRIQLGKLMLMTKKCLAHHNKNIKSETEKKETWEIVSDSLFKTAASKSERFKLMNVASIPNVDAYFFLGITRLKEIEPLVRDSKSKDPIGEILTKSSYVFELEDEFDPDVFIRKLQVAVNCVKLEQAQVPYVPNEVEKLTQQHGIITDKFAKKIKVSVNAGASILDAIAPKAPSPAVSMSQTVNMAPSYNEFEETVLKLSGMIEDILDDSYVPDYDPELTAKWLKVYLQINKELIDFWSANWKDFDKKI